MNIHSVDDLDWLHLHPIFHPERTTNVIKAASSDGRDFAPGSPPTGGFRKTGNGEQYTFKKVNIEEYVKVIICTNLLPAGGAMSITEH